MAHQMLEDLLGRFITGELSPADRILLAQLIEDPEQEAILESFVRETLMADDQPDRTIAGSSIKAEFMAQLDSRLASLKESEVTVSVQRKPFSLWIRYAAAAVILLAIVGGYMLWSRYSVVPAAFVAMEAGANDIAPGHEGAILTLADGKQIVLDSSRTGTLATQGQTAIAQRNAGQLVYHSATVSNATDTAVLYNTLTTPRGRRTSVTLSDGTQVWLNAASSIRFPAVFAGKQRKVEVTGEAYFEIAKNASMPFVVGVVRPEKGSSFEIQVLGTSFNIMAYEDEPVSTTSLVEGLVNVVHPSGQTKLGPGQALNTTMASAGVEQSRLVADADIAKAIAWKNGQFLFHGDELPGIMKQLSRWYDIDVEFDKNINDHYTGKISRQVNISQVLKMLETAGGVTFSVQGKVVKVLPKTI